MNPNWKTFLIENGATFSNQNLSFESSNLEQQDLMQGTVLSDLSDKGLIAVSGEDAEIFLQNQLTNDLKNVTETNHQESAWCSPKGRIIANFRILKKGDTYILSFSHDLIELVIKKLRMYVMMSKVNIEDITDSVIHFGLSGEQAQKILEETLTAPSTIGDTVQHNSLSVLRVAGEVPRFEIFGDLDDTKALWSSLLQKGQKRGVCALTANQYWLYQDILAGLPYITEASSEAWIPQMVNYVAIGGVDFKKGCYPGQEVVARLNYLGKTKRRMYRLALQTDELPNVGTSLSSANDKGAGKILNAALNPNGTVEALAILKIAEADNALWLENKESATAKILDLPYKIEDQ